MKANRSYVVRGSNIGVFKTDDDNLKYVNMIRAVKDKQGTTFSPRKV